jgi:peptidoglycan-N-acetylglucosamine deacetylase
VKFNIQGLLSLIYPNSITSFPGARGKLFFTFDDGPNPSVTPYILDILNRFDAKATFFCTGLNVEKYPELYLQILNSGHATGNHSYSHLNGFKCTVEEYIEDVSKAQRLIKSDLFRPPYGKISPAQYRQISKNYRIIFWDIIANDFKEDLDAGDCINIVLKNARDGSVIVFHDNDVAKERVLKALPEVLLYFRNSGCSFNRIDSNCFPAS